MKTPFKKQSSDFYSDRASLLKCVGDPNTLKILDVLAKSENPCVSDITKKLDVSISAVSHQLSKLKAMGIVETKRTGQTICYTFSNSDNANFVKKLIDRG